MAPKRRIYEFDDFRIDSGQCVLTKAGRATRISPTLFRALLLFLERPGELIRKEEIIDYVWSKRQVDPGSANRSVADLRKLLGQERSEHRYIETIPKLGYRFVAPVRASDYLRPAGIGRKRSPQEGARMIGREYERDVLSRSFDDMQAGKGSIVCISGEMGVGKTALVDAFVEDLTFDGQRFHFARGCSSEPYAESEPLVPWIESLSAFTQEPAISAVVASTAPNWHREISHTGPGVPRQMKRELLDLLSQISPAHPVVIAIDDFHWADPDSVDMLSFLASRIAEMRILIVVCYRLVEMRIKNHPFLHLRAELLGRSNSQEIRLAPLSRKHVEQYLALDNPTSPQSQEFASALFDKSDGNPLLLRELLRSDNQVTDAIRRMIQSQLDRLNEGYQQLLSTASVQGREFDSAILAATVQLEPEDVEDALHTLDQTYNLIHRIREEELPDGKFTVRYRFAYRLHHEVCNASLEPTRKASLTASVAQALLAQYGN